MPGPTGMALRAPDRRTVQGACAIVTIATAGRALEVPHRQAMIPLQGGPAHDRPRRG